MPRRLHAPTRLTAPAPLRQSRPQTWVGGRGRSRPYGIAVPRPSGYDRAYDAKAVSGSIGRLPATVPTTSPPTTSRGIQGRPGPPVVAGRTSTHADRSVAYSRTATRT